MILPGVRRVPPHVCLSQRLRLTSKAYGQQRPKHFVGGCERRKTSAVCLLTSSSKHRLVIKARCRRQNILQATTALSVRGSLDAGRTLFGPLRTRQS